MASARPLHDLALAASQLTGVPIRVAWPAGDEKPDVAGWYPLVGCALGAAAYALVAGVGRLSPGSDPLAALIAVCFLAVATRGLHWDGLADVSDAWCVADPVRRHAIMKDSATGAFGTLALVLVALLQTVSFAALVAGDLAVAVVLAVSLGRLAATFSAWLGSAARDSGLGASVVRRPGVSGVFGLILGIGALGSIVWLAFGAAAPASVGVMLGTGLLGALVVPHLVSGRFGGVTGDTMGASVMIVETLVLAAGALVVGA